MQIVFHPNEYCSMKCIGCYLYEYNKNKYISDDAFWNYKTLVSDIKEHIDEVNYLINHINDEKLLVVLFSKFEEYYYPEKTSFLMTPMTFDLVNRIITTKLYKQSTVTLSIDRYKFPNYRDIVKYDNNEKVSEFNIYIYLEEDFRYAKNVLSLIKNKTSYIVFYKAKAMIKEQYDTYVRYADELKKSYGSKIFIDDCLSECTACNTISVTANGCSFCPVLNNYIGPDIIYKLAYNYDMYKPYCLNKWRNKND